MMNTMIGYDKCTTCQKAKKWLEEQNVAVTYRPIKEQNPTAQELAQWLEQSGLPVKKFINTSGQLYRSMGLKDKLDSMDTQEILELLASDGMLVKRPILVTDKGVIPGFRAEQWQELLER